MIVTILDIVTGQRRRDPSVPGDWEGDNWYWMEGNGSCDCNRAIPFGRENVTGICDGHQRYLIIDVEGNLAEYTREEWIAAANRSYPTALVKAHLPS